MLKSLKFSITFPTGKAFDQDIAFPNGTLSIQGKNGKGKSLILEMISYALFGMDAVRGAAGDYKKCQVELSFSVKGVQYRIARRNGATADLFRGDEPLASGTKPVNQKVVELLGYGLPVFGVANLISQGEIEALSRMRPGDRKALVDTTIGLDSIDALGEWVGQQAALLRKEAETMQAMLSEPVAPTAPGVEGSQDEVDRLTALKTERDQLAGWLAHRKTAPTRPECQVKETVEQLQAQVAEAQQLVVRYNQLKAQHDAIPDAVLTVQEIDRLEDELGVRAAWAPYDSWVAKAPAMPDLSFAAMEQAERDHAAWDKWSAAHTAFSNHKVECPSCQHEFAPGLANPGPEPKKPGQSKGLLIATRAAYAVWDAAPKRPDVRMPTDEKIPYSMSDLAKLRAAAEKADEKKKLAQDLADIGVLPAPRLADLAARTRYDQALQRYEADQAEYLNWLADAVIKEARIEEIGDVDAPLADARQRLFQVHQYARELAAFELALAKYREQVVKVEEKAAEAEAYKQAMVALKDLKAKVKTFLLPSLNKVASMLIRQMTAGQHQELREVYVNEDFEILVDGQALDTLNGSGKTVANLALRIALGQILTNKVFSVLMCDEVDAACDDERAASIAACLRNLTKNIGQVMIVSHKGIEADHYLDL